MVGTSQFFIGGMKRQHAVILESIWGRDSIIIHFPVLADGTPYSSSDLLYFTLLLYLDKIIPSPNSSSLSSLDKQNLSPTLIPQKYSETIPNSVLVAKQIQFYENILRQFQIMSLSILSLPAYLFRTLAIGV